MRHAPEGKKKKKSRWLHLFQIADARGKKPGLISITNHEKSSYPPPPPSLTYIFLPFKAVKTHPQTVSRPLNFINWQRSARKRLKLTSPAHKKVKTKSKNKKRKS